MPRPIRIATCHPTKRIKGRGLCANCYDEIWRKENPLKVREAARRYRDKHGNHRENELSLQSHIKSHYGLSLVQYKNMLEKQNGLCAICKRPQEGKRLSVDHNHETKKVRGLLCETCNTGLGCFKEAKQLLLEAVKYLEETDEIELPKTNEMVDYSTAIWNSIMDSQADGFKS